MKELLEEMIRIPGVSGYEDEIRDFIRGRIEEMGLPTEEDNIGNLIATLGTKGPHIVFIAHMDELGLVVTNIEADGSLRIRKVGGIDDRTLVGRIVEIATKKGKVTGVIGLKPPHLMTDSDDKKKVVSWEDVRVDVGTRSRRETEGLGVRVLDAMVFRKEISYIGRDLMCARGIDDRAGCAVLLDMLGKARRRKLPARLSFVWSVQEEIGLRGAKVIGFKLQPDYVFAVDTMTTTDAPMQGDAYEKILLGRGPALRMLDSAAIASPKLRKMIEGVAKRGRVPLQAGSGGGATDVAVIQEFGALAMPIGIPMRYTHSPTECASLKDIGNTSRLLLLTAEHIAKVPKKR